MLDRTFIELTAAELAVALDPQHPDRRFANALLDWLRRKGHAQRIAYTIPRRGERMVEAALAAGLGATSVVSESTPANTNSATDEPISQIFPKGGRPPVVWRVPRTIMIDLLEQPKPSL